MILTVDSSTNIASALLTHEGSVLHYSLSNEKKTHSQKLMPMIAKCFEETELTPQEVDAYCAISGPGSFTGLRIGIAAIQGLAYATGKPCISVTALDGMAYGALPFDGLIAPLIDARNAQVYSAVYDAQNNVEKIMEDHAGDVCELLGNIKSFARDTLFVGDGAHANREAIENIMGSKARFLDTKSSYTTAKGAAVLAQKYFEDNKILSPAKLVPYYLRDTSAKKRFK